MCRGHTDPPTHPDPLLLWTINLKFKVYQASPRNLHKLELRITDEVQAVPAAFLQKMPDFSREPTTDGKMEATIIVECGIFNINFVHKWHLIGYDYIEYCIAKHLKYSVHNISNVGSTRWSTLYLKICHPNQSTGLILQ